jgi:hypothetical protein
MYIDRPIKYNLSNHATLNIHTLHLYPIGDTLMGDLLNI